MRLFHPLNFCYHYCNQVCIKRFIDTLGNYTQVPVASDLHCHVFFHFGIDFLNLLFKGYPAPRLTWSRLTNNGVEQVNDDEKFTISKQHSSVLKYGEFWYTLKIINVQANDYTDYYCQGKNKFGNSQSMVNLFGEFFFALFSTV